MVDPSELGISHGKHGRSGPEDFTDPTASEPSINPEFFGASEPAALKVTRRWFLKAAGAGAVALALARCGPGESSPTPSALPALTPQAGVTEGAPTPKPTEVPLPTKPGAGGDYTPELLAQIEADPGVQKNIAGLTKWVQYYGSAAADRPFSPVSLPGHPGESATLHFKYLKDTKTNKWVAVLESTDTPYVGYLILPPIDTATGTFLEQPPPFSGGQIIPDNLKPTFLSVQLTQADIDKGIAPKELLGSFLALENGQWIRVDNEGKQVGFLNMKTGKWEALPIEVPYDIVAAYTEAKDVQREGATIHLELVTDQSVTQHPDQKINKIYLNPTFKNKYVENAEQSLVHAALDTFWHLARRTNSYVSTANLTFDQYLQWIAEAQAGKRPWEQVEFTTWANPLRTAPYDIQEISFRPDKIRLIMVDPTNPTIAKNMSTEVRGEPVGSVAFGTQQNHDGVLEMWVGFPFAIHAERFGQSFTYDVMEELMRLGLSKEKQDYIPPSVLDPRKYPENWDIVAIPVQKYAWRTALAFDPPDDEPWNH